MGIRKKNICRTCGKLYNLRAGLFSCSMKCRDEYNLKVKREKVDLSRICKVCEKTYYVEYTARNKKTSLCSLNCVGEFNRRRIIGTRIAEYETVKCLTCEKQIERRIKDTTKVFCSRSCRSKYTWKEKKLSQKMICKRYLVKRINGDNLIVRSRYEAIFIHDFLDKNNIKFDYEKHVILLNDGTMYTPDFYISENDTYIEIKGFERGPTIKKVNIMRDMNYNIIYINANTLKNIYGIDLSAKHINNIATELNSGGY